MFGFIGHFLGRKPLLGITGSFLSITITHLQVLQIIAAIIGIVIAVITAIIKILELRDKLAEKKGTKKTSAPRKSKPKSSS
jgi:hypothetical protein